MRLGNGTTPPHTHLPHLIGPLDLGPRYRITVAPRLRSTSAPGSTLSDAVERRSGGSTAAYVGGRKFALLKRLKQECKQ